MDAPEPAGRPLGDQVPYPCQLRFDGDALTPDAVIVLERGESDDPALVPCGPERAARSLETSTYMAGELRRYWPFAATLAAGTGVGPGSPLVAEVAARFAEALPCFTLTFGRTRAARLPELLETVEEVKTCA